MRLEAERLEELGSTPAGRRQVVKGKGGSIEGPRIRGVVPRGAQALVLERGDGVVRTDVRLTIETDDGAIILMTYRGTRHGAPDVLARVRAGEDVPADAYYFRIVVTGFETSSPRYEWLNRVVAVATGQRLPDGLDYFFHELL